MKIMRIIAATIASVCTLQVNAATVPDGKIIVRVEDGVSTRCINSNKDAITMHMRRLITNKKVGVFTEDKEAALVINTVLSGDEQGETSRKVGFPRMVITTVETYGKGYVSVPVEEKIFQSFSLTRDSFMYDSAEVEFAVLAKKKKAPFGVALAALADVSKSMPMPINPFSEGFKYFSEYANKVVDGSLTEQNNVASQSKEGKIALSFATTDVCTGDQEQTGTLAVVTGATGLEKEGYLDIKKEYCWKADLKPVFILKFATKPNDGKCSSVAATAYTQVNNPYMAFYLSAAQKAIATSAALQAKMISLPNVQVSVPAIPDKAVENSILRAYAPASAGGRGETLTATGKKLVAKVNALLKNGKVNSVAPASVGKPGTVILSTTAADSAALDLAESFKRCAAHAVSTEHCL